MKHWSAGLGVVLLFGGSVPAQAQIGSYTPPTVNSRPVVSPYLNLNRGGQSPAINYYNIVRPQIENHQAIQQLQQQFSTTQGMLQGQNQSGALASDEMAPTGRPAGGYFYYSHYFPLYGRGAGGMSGPGAVRR